MVRKEMNTNMLLSTKMASYLSEGSIGISIIGLAKTVRTKTNLMATEQED
jgi:hypothetical protein